MRKKVCKKIIVVLLLFIFAADGLNSNFNILNVIEIKAATTTVTRAQWIHSLVDMTGMKVEDNQLPDNYYNDVNKKTEYYDDIMKATAYGVIDTAAGKDFKPEEKVSREFVAHTLNFCMGFQLDEKKYTFSDDNDCTYKEDDQIAINQGWLSLESGKFVPKGEVSETDIKNISKNVKEILSKQEVKEDYDSTWNVVSGVKTIPATTEAVIEDNKVIITDLTQKINTGDIFVVYQGEVGVPLKAENISVTGNKTIITTTDVKDYDNAFSKVDAEGIIESDELTFEPLDGTQLDVTTENRQEGTGVNRAVKKVKTVSFNKTFKVTGNLSSSVKGTLKNVQVKYNILTSTGEVMVQVEGDLNMTGTIKAAANTSIDIMAVKIPGIGGLTLTANVDAEGKFSSTVTSHMLTGISYSKAGGFRTIKSFKENGGSDTAVEASASIGATLKFGITDLKLITGYVYGKAGVTAQFNDTVWATGTPGNCRTFLAYMYASYGAEASCMFKKDLYSKNTDIYTLQNSPMRVYHHYEDGRLVPKCSRGMTFDYFTKYYSAYGSSGWSGYNGAAGLDDEGKEYQIYKYSLSNDEDGNKVATITEYYGNARNLEIPEEIDGYKVVGIGNDAFAKNQSIMTARIPESVAEIGNSAFAKCVNLRSVNIPKKIKFVGGGLYEDGPFSGCSSLKTVTFEDGITRIDKETFKNCTGIEKIEIPDTVTEIGESAFERCTNLKEIKIKDGVKVIEASAFRNCTSLISIEIPNSVEGIGNYTFSGCKSLKDVILPNIRQNIVSYMFNDCTALEEITLPSTVTTIQDHAFKGCTNLKTVNWSKLLTNINSYAFENCISLEKAVIPNTVKKLEEGVFYNCDALTDITIPDSVISLGNKIFYDCDALKNVGLGMGIKQIPISAFEHCDVLKEIIIPHNVTKISANAFTTCVALTDVTIPKATKEIAGTAFSYPQRMTITGVPGSYAETFAKEQDIKFIAKEIKVNQVSLSDEELFMNKGAEKQLILSVSPKDFTDDISWKSSNVDVVLVTEDGLLKAKTGGTATIKVTVGDISKSCKITVVQPITSIYLNKTKLELQSDEEYQLTADMWPQNAYNKQVEWASSDNRIATVDQNGMVKTHSKGTATITVKAKDGGGALDECKVTVTNNLYEIQDIAKLESTHPYENNCTDIWKYTVDKAESLQVTFDSRTEMETDFDYLYIYDKEKKQVGKYTGTELAGKTIEVPGNTLRIQLQTDNGGNAYGFKVAEIKAKQDNTVQPPTTEEPKPSTTTHKPESTEQKEIKLTRIVLSGISTKIAAGKKIKLTSFILPENASNKKLIWKTSNKKYATVSSNGIITINKKAGGKTVIITATAKDGSGKKATYKIKIMKGKVKKIVISGAKTVKVDKTISLKAKITASRGANKKIKWTSSNTKYATVSSSGKVKALKAGKKKTVKITAMATDGSGKKATKIIKIK